MVEMTSFKAKLIELPKIQKNGQWENYGKFTVGKKYRVYAVYGELKFTDFLIADDEGVFRWVNISIFRRC